MIPLADLVVRDGVYSDGQKLIYVEGGNPFARGCFELPTSSEYGQMYLTYLTPGSNELKVMKVGEIKNGSADFKGVHDDVIPLELYGVAVSSSENKYVLRLADLRRPPYHQPLRYTYGISTFSSEDDNGGHFLYHNLDSDNYIVTFYPVEGNDGFYAGSPAVVRKDRNYCTLDLSHGAVSKQGVGGFSYWPVKFMWVALDLNTGAIPYQVTDDLSGSFHHNLGDTNYCPIVEVSYVPGNTAWSVPFLISAGGTAGYTFGSNAVTNTKHYSSFPDPKVTYALVPDEFLESKRINNTMVVGNTIKHQHLDLCYPALCWPYAIGGYGAPIQIMRHLLTGDHNYRTVDSANKMVTISQHATAGSDYYFTYGILQSCMVNRYGLGGK